MKKILGKYPVCDSELEVIRLSCPGCNINIEGNFFVQFKAIKGTNMFLETFIMNRGNIKEIEKSWGYHIQQ